MKILNFLFFCLFSLSVLSCTQSVEKRVRTAGEGDTETGMALSLNEKETPLGEEDFDQFIRRFSTHDSFQLERIKFPISVIIPDDEHEGMAPIEETIGRYEWEMLDLTYDSTYLTRPYDQYYQGVRYKNDTAIVEIRGIDNGIYADYYFTLIDKKWFLVTLYEASF